MICGGRERTTPALMSYAGEPAAASELEASGISVLETSEPLTTVDAAEA